MPLILVFVECGLELIPKHIRNHPAVKNNLSSRIYSSQLLDNSLHFSAMKDLKEKQKRGRPDIIHNCLLNALGSPLNKNGHLIIIIHTIKNKIYELNPEIRIARNYNRFKGLMAKLLIDGNIETESSRLITQFNGNLKELINKFENPEIYLLSSKGKLINKFNDLFIEDINKNYIVIIGGFQKNNFSKALFNISENLISISQYPLDAWIVTSRIITYYELIYKIL
ncbi:MAG: 16S rRNA methyltransferase [Candidatus Odinarchaeota archaeon]